MTTLTTVDLLTAIKTRGPIPTNNVRFNDASLIAIANEELRNTVYPMLLGVHEDFFLQTVRYVISVHPSGYFPLPRRAYGRGLREIKYRDANNNYYNLPQIDITAKDIYAPNSVEVSSQLPYGFYFYNDGIQLYGNIAQNVGGQIEMTYVLNPLTLIAPDASSRVIGTPVPVLPTVTPCVFSSNTTTLPTTWTLANGAARFDIIRPTTGAVLFSDILLTVANANMSNTTFTDVSSQLAFTDFSDVQTSNSSETDVRIVPAGQAGYVCIPPEANQLLVMAVCMRVYQSLGYVNEYQVGAIEFKRIKDDLQSIYATRITGEPKKITNRRGLSTYTLFPGPMRRRSRTQVT